MNRRVRARRFKLTQVIVGLLLLGLFAGLAWYLTSDRFRERVRRKVVAEIERITGGRTEMKSFRWNLSRLEFEATDVTIHGLESPDEVPYAHVDRLLVQAKVLSLFDREIGLRQLRAERPVVHLIVYPDGSTNQPTPKVKQESGRSPIDRLFDLQIDRLELIDGQVLYNDRILPLDLSANDVAFGMEHVYAEKRYDGSLNVGTMATRLQRYGPLESNTEVRFSLWHDRAELKSLRWASKRSQFEASGSMKDWKNPKIEAKYNASLDLAELASFARIPQLRGGHLDVNGEGSYQLGQGRDFASAGRLVAKNVRWRDAGLDLPPAHLGATFSLDGRHLALSNLFGSIFGGSLSGSAEIRDWMAKRQVGSARVRLARLDVRGLAAAFSTPSVQLSKIDAVGTADATVTADWVGSPRNAEAFVTLDVAPPPQVEAGQIPLTARALVVYRGAQQRLEVQQLNLATRATRLDAAGVVGSETASLNVALNSTDISEFQPALAAFGQEELPAQVNGRASFNGKVAGKLGSPTVSGHLQVSDFTTIITPAAQPGDSAPLPSPRRIHWDSLAADLEYAPAHAAVRNGRLERGGARIGFDASAQLRRGKFDESSPFTVALTVTDAELADLLSLASLDYPVTGKLSLKVSASGSRRDLRGQGHLQLLGGAIFGEPFKSLRADLRFAGNEAQLDNLVFSHNGARITGTLAYNWESEGYRFELRGDSFQLADFRRLQTERLTIAGLASFTASGSGTLDAPVINGRLQVGNMVLNSEEVGSLQAEAVTRGSELRLTARSLFENAELALDGTVQLRGDLPAELRLHFNRVHIDPLLTAYLQRRVTGHSQIAGAVDLQGPLRQPRLLTVNGTIDQFSAELERIRIASEGPARFTLRDQVFRLESLHLVGEGTNLTARATVALAGEREISGRLDGQVNLKLLQTFDPDLVSYGGTTIGVVLGGSWQHPEVTGQVRIEKAGISFIDLPNGLSEINGVLVFNENRLQVQSLTAHSGGGTLEIGGFISYARGITFNLTARSTDIRLRYPPGVSAMANADLRLAGSLKDMLLSGDIEVTRFGLNPRFDFALYLARSKQPPTVPDPASPLNHLRFDVHITSSPELQVQTSLAKVSGNVDLRLRGTAVRPVLLGRANVVEGDVSFNGTKYHIERGDVTFSNPLGITPILNVDASARVRDYDITIGLHGPVDKLSSTYRSDPPLPEQDVIALIALGRTREDSLSTQATQSFTESASSAILGQALESTVSSRVQKLFGVSRIKIDPQVAGPEGNPNARLTIEQQVSNKVTLTFITNLSQSAQQIVQIEYNVNRNFSVLAVRDQNGVLGFDIRYRQRKR